MTRQGAMTFSFLMTSADRMCIKLNYFLISPSNDTVTTVSDVPMLDVAFRSLLGPMDSDCKI